MPLRSALFAGDPQLEACLVSDPAHVVPGSTGNHVRKIQQALETLDGATIPDDEKDSSTYGPATTDAVLHYKTVVNDGERIGSCASWGQPRAVRAAPGGTSVQAGDRGQPWAAVERRPPDSESGGRASEPFVRPGQRPGFSHGFQRTAPEQPGLAWTGGRATPAKRQLDGYVMEQPGRARKAGAGLRIWRLGVRIPPGAQHSPGQSSFLVWASCVACLVVNGVSMFPQIKGLIWPPEAP
jgi:hypothetical protein